LIGSEQSESSEKVIPPHKARILVVIGAAIILHAAFLLAFWPRRWPVSYKWILLPDSIGAYFVLALGLQNLKNKNKSEHEGHKVLTKVTKTS
jgi:hypothetical protein